MQIFDIVMPRIIESHAGYIVYLGARAPLWATCRQVHDECTSILYGNCTFGVSIGSLGTYLHGQHLDHKGKSVITFIFSGWMTPTPALDFFDKMSVRNREMIRKVHVRIQRWVDYEGQLSLNRHLHKFLDFLESLPRIQYLRIDSPDLLTSCRVDDMPFQSLESFLGLRNTENIVIWDPHFPWSRTLATDTVQRLADHFHWQCTEIENRDGMLWELSASIRNPKDGELRPSTQYRT